MKCPRCGLIVTDEVPNCKGCGFSIDDLGRKLSKVPERKGFVNDFAGLLPEKDRADMEKYLSKFHEDYGIEMVLVTVKNAKPVKPSEYVFWLFNRWKVGGEIHTGVLLLLALAERRIESEVGYSIEPIISDVESGEILDKHVVPMLKSGKFVDALRKGVEELVGIFEEASNTEGEVDEKKDE
jgi:uncharacterized membrane protein YgcG